MPLICGDGLLRTPVDSQNRSRKAQAVGSSPTSGSDDLPAGRAVRLRTLTRTDEGVGHGDEVLVDLVQHWVPVPGHAAMVVLSGTTPCLDVADDLAAVFDRMAETLRFSDFAG
jgi:hypothetical protein